jgi:hypothetical protein
VTPPCFKNTRSDTNRAATSTDGRRPIGVRSGGPDPRTHLRVARRGERARQCRSLLDRGGRRASGGMAALDALPAHEREALFPMTRHLLSAHTGFVLRREFGIDAETAGRAARTHGSGAAGRRAGHVQGASQAAPISAGRRRRVSQGSCPGRFAGQRSPAAAAASCSTSALSAASPPYRYRRSRGATPRRYSPTVAGRADWGDSSRGRSSPAA